MSMHRNWIKEAKGNLDKADAMAREATGIDCSSDEVRTKQEFKNDADINVIVARCVKDPNVVSAYAPVVAPVFADVSSVKDFQASMEQMHGVEDAFMMLPPKVRDFFNHDPWSVVPFVKDPKNLDKAVELGVAIRKDVPPATPATTPAPPDPTPAK